MTHHIIKSLAALALSAMLIGTASAQENEAGKQKINSWIEFNLGVSFLNGSDGFNDHMQTYHPTLDYRSVYSAAAQIGVGLGVEYRRFTLGIHLNGMADNILSVKNQLVKKQDNLYHLDLARRYRLRQFVLHSKFRCAADNQFLAWEERERPRSICSVHHQRRTGWQSPHHRT